LYGGVYGIRSDVAAYTRQSDDSERCVDWRIDCVCVDFRFWEEEEFKVKPIFAFIAGLWASIKAALGRIVGSRKMIVNVISLAVIVASFLAPELGARIDKLGGYAALILFVLASGGVIELGDFVKAWAARPTNAQTALDEIRAELAGIKTITMTGSSGSAATSLAQPTTTITYPSTTNADILKMTAPPEPSA
jgi:hypothetical protein